MNGPSKEGLRLDLIEDGVEVVSVLKTEIAASPGVIDHADVLDVVDLGDRPIGDLQRPPRLEHGTGDGFRQPKGPAVQTIE